MNDAPQQSGGLEGRQSLALELGAPFTVQFFWEASTYADQAAGFFPVLPTSPRALSLFAYEDMAVPPPPYTYEYGYSTNYQCDIASLMEATRNFGKWIYAQTYYEDQFQKCRIVGPCSGTLLQYALQDSAALLAHMGALGLAPNILYAYAVSFGDPLTGLGQWNSGGCNQFPGDFNYGKPSSPITSAKYYELAAGEELVFYPIPDPPPTDYQKTAGWVAAAAFRFNATPADFGWVAPAGGAIISEDGTRIDTDNRPIDE